MNKWIISLAVMGSCGMVAPARAEDGKLTLEATIRVRGEAVDNQFRPGVVDSDAALFLRSNLFGEYSIGPVRIGAEVQDSRVYFERRHGSIGTNEVNALEPIQAYVAVNFTPRATLQLGRFTMDLGSRRLVARPIWRNSSTSFTGARFDWKSTGGDKLTAFWTMPQTKLPEDSDRVHDNTFALDRERSARQLFGAISTKANVLGGTAELYGYRLVEHDTPGFATRNRRLWTSGLHFARAAKPGRIDYDVEGTWQTGTTRLSAAATDLVDHRVSAWLVHGTIGKTFTGSWTPRIALNADYASGDTSASDYSRFDTLFGDTVFEFGPPNLYGAVTRSNLVSIELRAEAKPNKRIELLAAIRPLWLASATDSFANTGVRDPAGNAGHYAGTQAETRIRYLLRPDRIRMSAGVATLFKGRFLRTAANAPASGDTHYGFLETILSF
ncbi:MAG: alginate export family protein [Sphingomonas bacterium]